MKIMKHNGCLKWKIARKMCVVKKRSTRLMETNKTTINNIYIFLRKILVRKHDFGYTGT